MKCFMLVVLVLFCLSAAAEVRKHALIIGITYDDLRYAKDDATYFRDFLQDSLDFAPDRIEFLINQQATREGILRAIHRIGNDVRIDLNNRDTPIVYVYFSGHSVTDDNDTAYFLTYGSSPDIPGTGIRSDEFLYEIKNKVGSDRIIWFLDTCYAASSQNGGSSKSIATKAYKLIDRSWTSYFANSKGTRMGFFSSLSNEKSWEDPKLAHGIFTYYLLRGLKGEADQHPTGNADGQVTAGELKKYLELMVPIAAHRLGQIQNPQPTPVFDPDFPLTAKVSATTLGIYYENIPKEVSGIVAQRVMKGEVISSISFDSAGKYAIVTNKTYTGADDLDTAINEHQKKHPDLSLDSIWLYDGGGIAIFGANGYSFKQLPNKVFEKIKAAHAEGNELRNILVLKNGAHFLLLGDNGFTSDGLPDALLVELNKIHKADKRINHVAVSPDGGWVVIYDGYKSVGAGISPKMIRDLTSLEDRQKTILSLTFDSATHGWLIVTVR